MDNSGGRSGHETPSQQQQGNSRNNQQPSSQQQRNLSNNNNNSSISAGLFFADATLDLDEAHDIAETPEPPRRFLHVDAKTSAKASLRLPQLEMIGSSGSGSGSAASSKNNSAANSRSVSPSPPMMKPSTSAGTSPTSSTAATATSTTAATALNVNPQGPSSTKSLNGPMNRISNNNINNNGSSSNNNNNNGHGGYHHNHLLTSSATHRSRLFRNPPRWPRDLSWAIAFCVVVPLGLLFPSLMWHRQTIFGNRRSSTDDTITNATMSPLALPNLRHATLWSILLAYASALLLARTLYRTPGGGEGDDARYKASQFLLACVPVSVAMNVILVLAVYFLLPHAMYYALIPLWYFVRDVYLFRRWKVQSSGGVALEATSMTPSNIHSSQPNSTRHAFFQALTCMALDILSRSLRRNSFHRCIVTLLTLQILVSMVWRWAILGALNTGNPIWIILALIGGKWATGTIARLLSLISSGGVASWFAENAATVEELEMRERNSTTTMQNGNSKEDNKNIKEEEEEVGYDPSGIPEEYRTADASIYQSVMDFDDDGMDDDDQDDFEYGFSGRNNNSRHDDSDDYNFYDRSTPRNSTTARQKPTVKSLFLSGISVSFGSVAQCGLLGGPAQFVWCQLRKVDATRHAIVYRLQQQPRDFQPNRAVSIVMGVTGVTGVNASGGFRGMQIGQADHTSIVQKLLNRANIMARAFVRAHSDLAMSHVAAYYKSYKRAALDVSSLVEQAGMERIIHDDITTHITSCVGGSITGAIIIFTGYSLVRKLDKEADTVVHDASVAQNTILSFILCYTIIFTVLEPLRASIKACYVCFAERPQSLRQAFPLIFHRLSRMAESNLSMS